MSRLKIIAFFALLVLIGLGSSAFAQMSGTSYGASPAGIVGGGGNSSSAGYILSGAIPLAAGGGSVGTGYAVVGGAPAVQITSGMAGLSVEYQGEPFDTVTVTNRTLKVAYAGGEGTATGTFYYRFGGASSYQSAAMTAGTGDTLQYQITSAHLNARGLEYYFAITRGTDTRYQGSSTTPFTAIVSMTNAQCQRPDALPDARYIIAGISAIPQTGVITSVFEDDFGEPDLTQWRLGRYNAALDSVIEYPACPAPQAGRGYWMIARGGKRYGVIAYCTWPNVYHGGNWYYEVPLDSGWNQFANPFSFDISWAEILFDDNGTVVTGHPTDVLDDHAYFYNGTQYQSVSTIGGWDGAFVLIKKTGVNALVRFREATKKAPAALKQLVENPTFDNWTLSLELASNDLFDVGNIIGVNENATDGADYLDLAEPPPAPGSPRLAFRIPDDKTYPRRIDFRKPYTDGATWYLEFNSVPNRMLSVDGLEQIPDGMEAWLVLDNGSTVQLTEDEPLALADDVKSGRLIISTKEYLSEAANVNLPLQYSLKQNFPNPFNGGTSISFTIEKPGLITLGVYNIIGQQIKTLINTDLGVGEYTVTWDGNDEDGNNVASGIYFYRMTAGEYVRCRKMLFLK